MAFGYSGYRPYRRNQVASKPQRPELGDIKKLALDDLVKLKRAAERYRAMLASVTKENHQIVLRNEQRKRTLEAGECKLSDYEKRYVAPALERVKTIESKLDQFKVGFIARQFGWNVIEQSLVHDTLRINKYRRTEQSIALLKQYEAAWATYQHNSAALSRIQSQQPAIQRYENERSVRRATTMKINNQMTDVYLPSISLDELEEAIREHHKRLSKNKEIIGDLRARVATNELETRRLAHWNKRHFANQLKVVEGCPYCGGPLTEVEAHRDHIHPVAKGGRSTDGNMVFVCSACNQRKGAKTLRKFLAENKLDESKVYARLEILRKDI